MNNENYMQNNNTNQNNININDTNNHKNNNSMKIIIVVIAILLVLVLIFFLATKVIFVDKGNSSSSSLEESLVNSNCFSINNREGKYALFNIDGKQLTDFKFKTIATFVNGAAIVSNENDEKGIISSNGKMIVDFGKYKFLYQEGPLYKVVDTELNRSLLDASGKVLLTSKNLEVSSESGNYLYVLVTDKDKDKNKDNGKYIIYDYNGKVLLTLPISEDTSVKKPLIKGKDNYLSIFYNNVNYIFNVSNSKKIISFEESSAYYVSDINKEDHNEIALRTYDNSYNNKNYAIKLLKNGKIIYTKEFENSGDALFQGSTLVYGTSVLKPNGDVAFEARNAIYKDYNNYIKLADGSLNGAELYVNGKLKETYTCNDIRGGYSSSGIYLLRNCNAGSQKFIHYDGTVITSEIFLEGIGAKHEVVSHYYAAPFDENGYGVIECGTGQKYCLIDSKGKQVSEVYYANTSSDKIYYIQGTKNLYYGTNKNHTYTVFEVNGKELFETKTVINKVIVNNVVYMMIEADGKYTIRNLDTNKEIISLNSKPSLSQEYFTTSENSKTQYYSYVTGQKFYEE